MSLITRFNGNMNVIGRLLKEYTKKRFILWETFCKTRTNGN